jgi:hypothetical protein
MSDTVDVAEAVMERLLAAGCTGLDPDAEGDDDVLAALQQVEIVRVQPETVWLDDYADESLHSAEGGRALAWYHTKPALVYIYDPARAGHEIEATTEEGAMAIVSRLRSEGWEAY